jgi:hypothetical protein
MKIRQSFVTNSSSSSYVLIVNNEKPKGTYNLIDLVMMYQMGSKLSEITPDGTLKFSGAPVDKRYFESWTIDNYINNTQYQITWKREELIKIQAEVDKLNEISQLADELILLTSKADTIKRAKEELRWDITNKETKLKKLQSEIEKEKANCKLLKEYKDKGPNHIVIFTDIDNWGSSTIQQIIEDTGAVILKKEFS